MADSSALSCPREVCGTGEGRPLKEIDTLRDPTPSGPTIDLYRPSTDAQAFSPQSPSSLRLLSLHSLLERPATAAPLFISRIYPGIRLLFCCNPYTTQGSFHAPYRPKGSDGAQNFDNVRKASVPAFWR